MDFHDPLKGTLEIRRQLASEKRRLAFFFGAGTSMAVGIPGIYKLTEKVSDKLGDSYKQEYEKVKNNLQGNAHVEMILNRIRLIRELLNDSEEQEFEGISGTMAKELDLRICQSISEIISDTPQNELIPQLIFAQWLRDLQLQSDFPIEIFTTNYDLLFEQAFEKANVLYFDGFVGTVAPVFTPEAVEPENIKVYPPQGWVRLWKIHGSINWYFDKSYIISLTSSKTLELSTQKGE